MAAKQMHLAIFFDRKCFSSLKASDIGSEMGPIEVRENGLVYSFNVSQPMFLEPGRNSVSRLLGKRLIAPPALENCGIWPFVNSPDRFEEFIIGTDAAGQPITNTAGAGLAPLTPVYFRRDVLAKYYSQSAKYAVGDGYVSCGSIWRMPIDIHHNDFVVAYLCDLNEDLPHSERLYWKSFNVAPEGGISEISARRDFLAEFVEPERPDLVLKNLYSRANAHWKEGHGWNLFKELPSGDQHVLATLRVPLGDDQSEFDGQVIGLTKLLIDALDETAISGQLDSTVKRREGDRKA
ncbi:MAG TPA: hypothetical protein VH988_14365 [Thermoanaerobaculia bacterium]|jgi:hypothetical protein|nr:hypothetical protein [Thermoanaerobaculia bacterium]